MKRSVVCPVPAGSVVIRDIRAWHGGTPNVSDHARAIPNVEYSAPWWREPSARHIDPAHLDDFSDFGREIVKDITLVDGHQLSHGYRPDVGVPNRTS